MVICLGIMYICDGIRILKSWLITIKLGFYCIVCYRFSKNVNSHVFQMFCACYVQRVVLSIRNYWLLRTNLWLNLRLYPPSHQTSSINTLIRVLTRLRQMKATLTFVWFGQRFNPLIASEYRVSQLRIPHVFVIAGLHSLYLCLVVHVVLTGGVHFQFEFLKC